MCLSQVMEGAGTMLAVAVGPHSQHGIILALLTTTEEDDDGKCVDGNTAWITIISQAFVPPALFKTIAYP